MVIDCPSFDVGFRFFWSSAVEFLSCFYSRALVVLTKTLMKGKVVMNMRSDGSDSGSFSCKELGSA